MEASDLKGSGLPLHAGLWGLARCLRLESPGSLAGCVDLGPLKKPSPKDILARPGTSGGFGRLRGAVAREENGAH